MNLLDKLRNLKKNYFIIICVLTVILISHFISRLILSSSLDKGTLTSPLFENESLIYIFTVVVILAPLLETFIFQFCIIEILLRLNRKKINKFIIIITSSLMFGLSHSFNVQYFIFGVILGILLSSCYLLAKIRKDINPFMLTLLVHASYNGFVFFINEII